VFASFHAPAYWIAKEEDHSVPGILETFGFGQDSPE
jgi:hypothetical protein